MGGIWLAWRIDTRIYGEHTRDMSDTTTRVTEISTRTVRYGIEVDITVNRTIGPIRNLGAYIEPDVSDVPVDIRDALRAWLDS